MTLPEAHSSSCWAAALCQTPPTVCTPNWCLGRSIATGSREQPNGCLATMTVNQMVPAKAMSLLIITYAAAEARLVCLAVWTENNKYTMFPAQVFAKVYTPGPVIPRPKLPWRRGLGFDLKAPWPFRGSRGLLC